MQVIGHEAHDHLSEAMSRLPDDFFFFLFLTCALNYQCVIGTQRSFTGAF